MSYRFLLGLTAFLALLISLSWANLKQELSRQKAVISTLEGKERSILEELEILTEKIRSKREKIEFLQDEIAKREILLRQLKKDIQKKDQELSSLEEIFRKRLKALAMTGRLGWLNVLFSPSEVSSFLRRQEYSYLILQHDYILAEKISSDRDILLMKRNLLRAEKKRLFLLREEYERELKTLEMLRKEKEALLGEVRRNKRLYRETLRSLQAAYAAIEKMAQELEETKENLRAKEMEAKAKASVKTEEPLPFPPLLEVKGHLLPPVEGEVTRLFGVEIDPVTGEKIRHKGITIAVPPGSPVKAPYGGKIVRIKSLPGEGLVVFIDHGRNFLSVIGGLGKVNAILGAVVRPGEIIGEVGDLPFGHEGVYYELRYKNRPLNPLDWLDVRKLKFLR